ncbi:transposable element Tcb1 transposase [Trichonephila clavipes]|uniref:Transposable element Tcb1 transposase n=1 Tax=Trichonephila clavipes TaxID=2585209 RepID=A0A8X6RHL7_TRICX|nr:transposable element Tcb1 transposase [Trichonephila clavipes]
MLSTQYVIYFSFKKVLHKTSCLKCGIKEINPEWLQRKARQEVQNVVCTPLSSQIAIPNIMQLKDYTLTSDVTENITQIPCKPFSAKRKHLDDFLRGRIIGRLECGCTQLEESEELGIAQSVIFRLWQRFQDDGHIGLYARRPVRCVPLTATHCRLRLTWSREHALWTLQQWSCVMFSDESRFSLQSDSRRTLIWRAPGSRYNQENTIERHRYGGAGWLVWVGIILGSRTDLHVQI